MAQLILTEAEKKLATWLELDDESLGKFVKANIMHVKEYCKENIAIFTMSCATALCSIGAESNSDTIKINVDGLKNKINDFGNWQVTIKRVTKQPKLDNK